MRRTGRYYIATNGVNYVEGDIKEIAKWLLMDPAQVYYRYNKDNDIGGYHMYLACTNVYIAYSKGVEIARATKITDLAERMFYSPATLRNLYRTGVIDLAVEKRWTQEYKEITKNSRPARRKRWVYKNGIEVGSLDN